MPDPSRLGVHPIFLVVGDSVLTIRAMEQAVKAVFPEAIIKSQNCAGTDSDKALIACGVSPKTDTSDTGETDLPADAEPIVIEVVTNWQDGLVVTGSIRGDSGGSVTLTDVDREILDPIYSAGERQQRVGERVRLIVQKLIVQGLGVPQSPWGILVGVRPTKIVHRYLDRGFDYQRIASIMGDVYGLASHKIELLFEVVRRQRKFFHVSGPKVLPPISIYVGIPFCPTRCRYCSFAAYPLASHGHLLPGFFQALLQEIREVGHFLREHRLAVETWYIGGGTPTVLTAAELQVLLETMHKELPARTAGEFTVEAGRPDTITLEKLSVLKDYGVTRLSINPQTMQQRTLDAIGRAHTVSQVREAFRMARRIGFPVINADLIIGLPGEGLDDIQSTLTQIGALGPENLTIHSLAVKRAATWRALAADLEYPDEAVAAQMMQLTEDFARQHGLVPYYLYRHRYIVGDLENVGYALPGTESIYNIQMMEERQTILAFGGGGISKFVNVEKDSLVRQVNPKCPGTYTHQIAELIQEKCSALRDWIQSMSC